MRRAPIRFLLASFVAALVAASGCNSTPRAGAGGHQSGAGGGATTSTPEGTGGAVEGAMCSGCLDTKCAAQKAACTDDCLAIQACLDAVCYNLSAIGAADEGTCQVHCQSLHAAGKAAHLDWVSCVTAGTCQPPCASYSHDYDVCVATQNAGPCKSALDACTASADCQTYRACSGACTNFADCEACATGDGPAAGEALYEAYQLCLDETCFAQGWLPSL